MNDFALEVSPKGVPIMDPELVLVGGRVHTLAGNGAQASGVAIAGERIVAVGDSADIRGLAGAGTRVVELHGRTVLPGINDAHLHLSLFGQARPPFAADLTGRSTVEQVRTELTRSRVDRGGWLVGHGWRDANIDDLPREWAGGHRAMLDSISGSRPVVLYHGSGHSVLVNTAALEAAGISSSAPATAGDGIVRDADGVPTGALLESAVPRVTDLLPPFTAADRLTSIRSAMETLNALGVTSVTDPVVWPELMRDYKRVEQAGNLSLRLNTLAYWDWPSPVTTAQGLAAALSHAGIATGLGDHWLRVGGVKLFADGVPSHGTAWLYDEYREGGTGTLMSSGTDDESRYTELLRLIELAHTHQLQAQVHVTGDRAADAVIDAFVTVQQRKPWPGARHSLIHGTLLSEKAPARLAEHNIGVITSSLMRQRSGHGMVPWIGERRWSRAFPARPLLAAGAPVADSSDAPVTFPDWREGMRTFLGAADDHLGTVPEDWRLTASEALRLWTTGPAWFEHAEHDKGSIQVGKLADLAVLDGDPLSVAPKELPSLPIALTVVGGRIVHGDPADL